MKKCPRCALINSDAAMRCDCDYDFQHGCADEEKARALKSLSDSMLRGLGLMGAGCGLLLVTRLAAEKTGGFRIVFWGLVVWGASLFVRSYLRRKDLRD